jgi:hypothetical protein
MTIINDDFSIINKLETSPTDDARVVIYDGLVFIVQATEIIFFISLHFSPYLSLWASVLVFKPLILTQWVKCSTTVLPKYVSGSAKANGREPKSCLGWVFNFKLGYFVMHAITRHIQACPILELKTQPRFCLVSLSLSMFVSTFVVINETNICFTFKLNIKLFFFHPKWCGKYKLECFVSAQL